MKQNRCWGLMLYCSSYEYPTNTPRGFHVETTWKRSFPRRFNVESTWCVCRVVSSPIVGVSISPPKIDGFFSSVMLALTYESAIGNSFSLSKPLNKLWMLSLPFSKLSKAKLRLFLSTAVSSLHELFVVFMVAFRSIA